MPTIIKMGWSSLDRWGEARVIRRFEHGAVNDVRLIELDGRRAVARLSSKSPESLEWERDLLVHLASNGIKVPTLIPTSDGRGQIDGLTVAEYINGRSPENTEDWQLVASYLRSIHEVTQGWPQRPACTSSQALIHRMETSELLDFTVLPEEAVEQCRLAWSRLKGASTSVIHGDPNANNVFVTENGIVLIDWDEARVDVSVLDLAGLPHDQVVLDKDVEWDAKQAFFAWEAAICWVRQPEEALRCLGELRPEKP